MNINIPATGFGDGFKISRGHGIGAKPTPVDVSNGMPRQNKTLLSSVQRRRLNEEQARVSDNWTTSLLHHISDAMEYAQEGKMEALMASLRDLQELANTLSGEFSEKEQEELAPPGQASTQDLEDLGLMRGPSVDDFNKGLSL